MYQIEFCSQYTHKKSAVPIRYPARKGIWRDPQRKNK